VAVLSNSHASTGNGDNARHFSAARATPIPSAVPSPESLLALVGLAGILFISTNIDDVVLLVAFLANPKFRTREVVAGQIAGIGLLYAASVAASRVSLAVAPEHVAWLGLVPIALGVKELAGQLRDDGNEDERDAATKAASGAPDGTLARALAVAAVTIANGGDNLGVYIPVFAVRSMADVVAIGVVFVVMTAALCAAGHWLVNHSAFSTGLRRYAGRSVPFVLIAIGVWILIEPRLG
jgi:cadmium resistance protein CadD (predicted permease)